MEYHTRLIHSFLDTSMIKFAKDETVREKQLPLLCCSLTAKLIYFAFYRSWNKWKFLPGEQYFYAVVALLRVRYLALSHFTYLFTFAHFFCLDLKYKTIPLDGKQFVYTCTQRFWILKDYFYRLNVANLYGTNETEHVDMGIYTYGIPSSYFKPWFFQEFNF